MTQQSDGSCDVTSDSQVLYKVFEEQFFFLQTNMKKILRLRITVLLATMTRCNSYPIADITLF